MYAEDLELRYKADAVALLTHRHEGDLTLKEFCVLRDNYIKQVTSRINEIKQGKITELRESYGGIE